jgi:hypothetical protein
VPTEAGEYIVGAYLQHFHDCDIVVYNERQKGGKLAGLSELDVVGLNLVKQEAFLCEVTTHILGMLIKDVAYTIDKVKRKYKAQQGYLRNPAKLEKGCWFAGYGSIRVRARTGFGGSARGRGPSSSQQLGARQKPRLLVPGLHRGSGVRSRRECPARRGRFIRIQIQRR